MSYADDRRAVYAAVLLKRAGHHVILRDNRGRIVEVPEELPPVEIPIEVRVKDGRYELRVYAARDNRGGWLFEGASLEECVGKFINGRANWEGELLDP